MNPQQGDILDLLRKSALSVDFVERNQCTEQMSQLIQHRTLNTIDELFSIMCTHNKENHILAFSFMHRTLKDIAIKHKANFSADLSEYFKKAYNYWVVNGEIGQNFQKENIVTLAGLYFSIRTFQKFFSNFIIEMCYTIFKLASKNDQSSQTQLNLLLQFYNQILREVNSHKVMGSALSVKARSGFAMVGTIVSKISPSSSFEASIWLNFIVQFGELMNGVCDVSYLIKCLNQFSLSDESMVTLLQFFSKNAKPSWPIENKYSIIVGLIERISLWRNDNSKRQSTSVEALLKCLRKVLLCAFSAESVPSNPGQALALEAVHSYEQFSTLTVFLIECLEYYTLEACENLPELIEYSISIIRLYAEYTEEEKLENFVLRLLEEIKGSLTDQKLIVLYSCLPRGMINYFATDYELKIEKVLSESNQWLFTNYEPLLLNFLIHHIEISEFLPDLQNFSKILVEMVTRKEQMIMLASTNNSAYNDFKRAKVVQSIVLVLQALSKLSKYASHNLPPNSGSFEEQYFSYMLSKVFSYMLNPENTNVVSLSEILFRLASAKNTNWNYRICSKCIEMAVLINQSKEHQSKQSEGTASHQKSRQQMRYQVEVELLRVINKTLSLSNAESLDQIHALLRLCDSNLNSKKGVLCLKQDTLILTEQILVQANELLFGLNSNDSQFASKQNTLQNLISSLVTENLLSEVSHVFQEILQIEANSIEAESEEVAFEGWSSDFLCEWSEKQLYLSCVRIILELSAHEEFLKFILELIAHVDDRLKEKSILCCIWQSVSILHPQKVPAHLVPTRIRDRLQKIFTEGGLIELLSEIAIKDQSFKKSTKTWCSLYREFLREDSIVNELVENRVAQIKVMNQDQLI